MYIATLSVWSARCCGERKRSLQLQRCDCPVCSQWSRAMSERDHPPDHTGEIYAIRRAALRPLGVKGRFVALHYPRNWLGSVSMEVNSLRFYHMLRASKPYLCNLWSANCQSSVTKKKMTFYRRNWQYNAHLPKDITIEFDIIKKHSHYR